jgi:hypothetical protein
VPGTHPTISRDHEYKRHGTVTLMAAIDLLTGQVHALVKDPRRTATRRANRLAGARPSCAGDCINIANGLVNSMNKNSSLLPAG